MAKVVKKKYQKYPSTKKNFKRLKNYLKKLNYGGTKINRQGDSNIIS